MVPPGVTLPVLPEHHVVAEVGFVVVGATAAAAAGGISL